MDSNPVNGETLWFLLDIVTRIIHKCSDDKNRPLHMRNSSGEASDM